MEYTNLKKTISNFESVKNDILEDWLKEPLVNDAFARAGLSKSKFKAFFAPRIIEYFISVVKGENEAGDCPVVGVMITLFHRLNMQIEDIFMICTHLKNIMTRQKYYVDEATLIEIQYILDSNLHGVIQNYMETHYCNKKFFDKCKIKTKDKPPLPGPAEFDDDFFDDFIDFGTDDGFDNLEYELITATEFLEHQEIDGEIMEDLHEFEDEFDVVFHGTDMFDERIKSEVAELLTMYLRILSTTIEFDNLYQKVQGFRGRIKTISCVLLSEEQSKNIYILVNSILKDLITWKKELYDEKTLEDIHFYDASIMSGIAQFEMFLNGE